MLKLCSYNKLYFELDEPLHVSIWIKNVPQMQFKLFEINTDTYYRKNSFKPFESDVNLDGLGPQIEKIYDYKEYPAY